MSDLLTQLLGLLVPFVVGLVSKYGWDLLERLVALLERIPATWKPLAVAVVAWIVGLVANALQVQLPGDLHVWTPDTVHSLVAAIFAVIVHLATKPARPGVSAPTARVSDAPRPPQAM
jgi:hypothetical protein